MNPRFLLDTHILIRWLTAPKLLSKAQTRVLRDAVRRGKPFAVSAVTLLEIALLADKENTRGEVPVSELFGQLESNLEVAALGPSDQRIIHSDLVAVL